MSSLPSVNAITPEQVPTHEERAEAVTACLGGVLPRGIICLIAKQAMERFDDEIFGRQQWIDCWGATPVTLTRTLPELRDLVKKRTISGAQTEKLVDQMNEVECANFLGGKEVCREEHFEPTDELYECLNRRVRPDDKLLAGFTCVVTYIPQFVRKDGKILAVTARTLALDFGPHPIRGEVAKLLNNGFAFGEVLTLEDADRTEPSCYFIMERDVDPDTRGKKPSVLMEEVSKLGDKGWQLPEPRNFFATVFSRRAWKDQFLYRKDPYTFTYGHGKSRDGYFLAFGSNGSDGLVVDDGEDLAAEGRGAGGSRKFSAKIH